MRTHKEAKARRKQIAEYATTHSDMETALKFNVHPQTVRFSRIENDVNKKDKQFVPASSYEIMAAMIRGEKHSEIAKRFGVSRQFIGQIRDRAQKHGVFAAVQSYATKKRDGNTKPKE